MADIRKQGPMPMTPPLQSTPPLSDTGGDKILDTLIYKDETKPLPGPTPALHVVTPTGFMPGQPIKGKINPPPTIEHKPVPSYVKCHVTNQPDGAMQVTFLIELDEAQRLRARAQGVDIASYIHENILKPSISSHVF